MANSTKTPSGVQPNEAMVRLLGLKGAQVKAEEGGAHAEENKAAKNLATLMARHMEGMFRTFDRVRASALQLAESDLKSVKAAKDLERSLAALNKQAYVWAAYRSRETRQPILPPTYGQAYINASGQLRRSAGSIPMELQAAEQKELLKKAQSFQALERKSRSSAANDRLINKAGTSTRSEQQQSQALHRLMVHESAARGFGELAKREQAKHEAQVKQEEMVKAIKAGRPQMDGIEKASAKLYAEYKANAEKVEEEKKNSSLKQRTDQQVRAQRSAEQRFSRYSPEHFAKDAMVLTSMSPNRILRHFLPRLIARSIRGLGAMGMGGGAGGGAAGGGAGGAGAGGGAGAMAGGLLGGLAASLGSLVTIPLAVAGIGIEALKGMYTAGLPAYNSLEATAKAGRIAGISTRGMGMLGSKTGSPFNISPMFARLNVKTPEDLASIVSAYGLPKGAGQATFTSALASQSQFMGFQGPEEWARTISGFTSAGFGFKQSINAVKTDLAGIIATGVKQGIPAQSGFAAFQNVYGAALGSGSRMSLSEISNLTGAGFDTPFPLLRSGQAQAAGIQAYSAQMGNVMKNPLLMAAMFVGLGNKAPTTGNIGAMARGVGVPFAGSVYNPATTAQFNQFAGMAPAFALQEAGMTGMMPPEAVPKIMYQMMIKSGVNKNFARMVLEQQAYQSGGVPAVQDTLRAIGVIKHGGGLGKTGDEFEKAMASGDWDKLASMPQAERLKFEKQKGLPDEGKLIEKNVEEFNLAKRRQTESNIEIVKLEASNIALQTFANTLKDATDKLHDWMNGLDPSALDTHVEPATAFDKDKAIIDRSTASVLADRSHMGILGRAKLDAESWVRSRVKTPLP